MIQRLTLALCSALLLVGSTRAQDAAPFTPILPLPILDESAPAPNFAEANSASSRDTNFWASGDYLFTFVRGMNLPPLVTTSPPGTAAGSAGVLGTTGASTLFGDNAVNRDLRSGFRLGMGYWFGPERKLGLEAGFMMIESQATFFSAASDGTTILARPFTNAQTGAGESLLVAFPGTGINSSAGSINIRAASGNLYEAHLDLIEKTVEGDWYRINTLFGYRFYSYNESLQINQKISPLNVNFDPGTTITTSDTFNTRNQFHGLDAGLRAQFFWNNLSLDLLGKIAFGNLNTQVNIGGNQVVNDPLAGVTTMQNAGFLAQGSNSGFFNKNKWWTLPEGGMTVNWQMSSNVNFRVGYSILALNGIARAGNQVDTSINPALFQGTGVATPTHPAFNLSRSDLIVQSINLGVVFSY